MGHSSILGARQPHLRHNGLSVWYDEMDGRGKSALKDPPRARIVDPRVAVSLTVVGIQIPTGKVINRTVVAAATHAYNETETEAEAEAEAEAEPEPEPD